MSDLDQYSFEYLISIATKMGIKVPKNKSKIVEQLKYEFSKRFVKIQRLGMPGKDGITYLVWDHKTEKYYAMKTYKKHKSVNIIKKEFDLQNIASKHGISPKVIDINETDKYIVMEKMEKTLVDLINEQNGYLSSTQQNQIIHLFYELDKLEIFHNDPNPLNIMLDKNNKFYIIDFGFARNFNLKDYKNFGTHPNKSVLCLGLLIWLKKIGFDCSKFKLLMDNISEQSKIDFDLIDKNTSKNKNDENKENKENKKEYKHSSNNIVHKKSIKNKNTAKEKYSDRKCKKEYKKSIRSKSYNIEPKKSQRKTQVRKSVRFKS